MAKYPGLPVVPDVFYLGKRYPGLLQTKFDRFIRETTVVFFARETLFLDRCDQLPILNDRRRRIAKSCKPQNIHRNLNQQIIADLRGLKLF